MSNYVERLTVGDVVQQLQQDKFTSPNFVRNPLERLRMDEPPIYYDVSATVATMPDGNPLSVWVDVIERDRLTDKELRHTRRGFMVTAISISDVLAGVQLVYPNFLPTQEVANYAAG